MDNNMLKALMSLPASARDQLAQVIFSAFGIGPDQISQMQTESAIDKQRAKAPKPEKFQAGGQTEAFSRSGQIRDYRNPATSANKAPTTSPTPSGPKPQATPPRGFRDTAPTGQLNTQGVPKPAPPGSQARGQLRLPPAGGSMGSQPPKGTKVPTRGGSNLPPVDSRRAAAAAKKAAAAKGTGPSGNVNIPKAGAAAAAEGRYATATNALKAPLRGTLNFAARRGLPALVAGSRYFEGKEEGYSRRESGQQAVGSFAGGIGGFRAGAMLGAKVPGPPAVKGLASLLLGTLGAYTGETSAVGLIKGVQGPRNQPQPAAQSGGMTGFDVQGSLLPPSQPQQTVPTPIAPNLPPKNPNQQAPITADPGARIIPYPSLGAETVMPGRQSMR